MKSVHFQVKDFYVYTISETLFHETDSFLAIIVDLWLSVAGKVRGRLEERAPHFKLAMKKFKVDHPDYFAL